MSDVADLGELRTLKADLKDWQDGFRDLVHQRDRLERERDEWRGTLCDVVDAGLHFCRTHFGPGSVELYYRGFGIEGQMQVPDHMSHPEYEELKQQVRAYVVGCLTERHRRKHST